MTVYTKLFTPPVIAALVATILYLIGAHAVASLKDVNFDGVNQASACGDCFPPDTHEAAGATQFVQLVNKRMLVYNKTPVPSTSAPALLRSDPLSTLFSYTAQQIFDPRVLYDAAYDRWIITGSLR
jgi:hypothetical protein